jgi:hypothetical protein
MTDRMKPSDFHPYILEIFDGYVHGKLTKREFMREAGKFAAAGVTGAMISKKAPARLCVGAAGRAKRSGDFDIPRFSA